MSTFNSMDLIEDAVETLEKSGFAYILVTGIGPKTTRVDAASFFKQDKDKSIRGKCGVAIEDYFDNLTKKHKECPDCGK